MYFLCLKMLSFPSSKIHFLAPILKISKCSIFLSDTFNFYDNIQKEFLQIKNFFAVTDYFHGIELFVLNWRFALKTSESG